MLNIASKFNDNKTVYRLALIFAAFVFILFSLLFFSFTVDDSYIVWRYAKNLVNNGHWNWNNNSEYVEGYSSFIFAVLGVLPELLNLSPPLFFKTFGLFLFFVLIRRLRHHLPIEGFLVALLLVVLDWKVYIHMFSGLETFLFIILLFELNAILLSIIRGEVFEEKVLWLLCLILPLVRPEAVLCSILAFTVFFKYKGKFENMFFFAGTVVVGVIYFWWRFNFFDSLLPNAVYLKGIKEGSFSLIFGNLYSSLGYFVTIIVLNSIINNKAFFIISITALAVFLIAYAHSSLMMNYADRFSFQLFMPILLLSIKFIKNNTKAIIITLTFSLLLSYNRNLEEIKSLIEYTPRILNSYKPLAEVLKKNTERHSTLLLADAGIIPYYTGIESYDAIGLATREIARNGLSYHYLKKTSADFIVLNSTTSDEGGIYPHNNQELILSFVKENNYFRCEAVKFSDNSYLILYCKKDLEMLPDIRTGISKVSNTQKSITLKSILKMEYLRDILEVK